MRIGQRVQTRGGRVGVVISIAGSWAEVSFPEGVEQVHVDDLAIISDGPAERFLSGELDDAVPLSLRLQALFLKHAYRYDPSSGLSNARIEPKIHQVFIAHEVTKKLQPRMILADEVGLGKTIEAGLILKELRARQMVDRVLIVCPASLQYQWQGELRSKFNEDFEILDGSAVKYLGQGGANPFTRRDNVLCSIPFASHPKRAEQIVEAQWDLVIFDEAHRVRRWLGGGQKETTTRAYRLADDLKELTPGLLLLTATPMQLHPFELYSLIELVEPGLYPTPETYELRRRELPVLNDLMKSLRAWQVLSKAEHDIVIQRHAALLFEVVGSDRDVDALSTEDLEAAMDRLVEKHPLAGVMVRNRKAEIGGFAGREASRVPVRLSDEELSLYEEVATYLRVSYNRATARKQLAIGFLMVTYHKMLASSSYAIHQSLKRRVAKLREQLAAHEREVVKDLTSQRLEEVADAPELSDVLVEIERLAYDPLEARAEIQELEALISRLGKLSDSKAEALLELLEPLFEHDPNDKVVIFTQFLETQTYLRVQLENADLRVAIFNGSMSIDEKEAAIRAFRGTAQILISTEAGGEGRNLQFAHRIINYDLPWNPMKVEQRIGRLDRIGQKHPVFIYNLACEGTVEDHVLDVLDTRIRLFTESVGSLDPILGDVERDIADLVMRHIDRHDEVFKQYAEDIERRTREARENERVLADMLLDRASLRRDRANELLGQPSLATHSDLQSHVAEVLNYYGGALKPHTEGGCVITLSPRLATRLRTRTPQLRGVFDPQVALELEELDFFAIGHELIDKIIELPLAESPALCSVRVDPELRGEPVLELHYQIRGEGPSRLGRVIRHVVGADSTVWSESVTSPPLLASEGSRVAVPPWTANAVEASRSEFNRELAKAREEVQVGHEARRSEELARARRIFSYREQRLRRRVEEDRGWIEEKERTGSDRELRILPARRGKLAKDVERLELLESDYNSQVDSITARSAEVTGMLWAVSLVVAQ